MAPKVTALMAENAIKDGAEVTDKKEIKRPKPQSRPIPAPVAQNDDSKRHSMVLEASIAQQLMIAQKQTEELTRLVESITAEKPVRLKVHRNMDRDSPEYLLMEYIDVIPVAFTRKLDS